MIGNNKLCCIYRMCCVYWGGKTFSLLSSSVTGRMWVWVKLTIDRLTKNNLLCSKEYSVVSNSLNQFSSVPVVSNSLPPHELQHASPPCPSPTPGVHSDSCPSSQWCHPAVSSCHPLLLLPPNPSQHQSFSMSQLLVWGGQSTGV